MTANESHKDRSQAGDSRWMTGNVALLTQGEELLAQIEDEAYVAPPPVPMGTVGGHLRHCLDFYMCFLDGLAEGEIDYDARRRDERIQQDRSYAMGLIAALKARLEELPADLAERPVRVSLDRAFEAPDAPLGRSTVRRELQFLCSHTTHHYALIAAQLRLQGIEPTSDFGVAPSTLEHERRQGTGVRRV
ncbi:MAG: DinB family protein [Acidobacteriota bacterium]